ncbi:hypothetical protein PM082_018645 [Marasmius tenuissimus]|nr:hypothetical protein PM082_018645 [Marasmius tenuissimus]
MLPFIIPLEFSLLFATRFNPVVAFRIEPPLPSTITPLQHVPFTWIRDPGDPKQFGFRKLGIGAPPSEILAVDGAEISGEFTLTFTQELSYSIVAIAPGEDLTFFTAPNLVVATSLDLSSSSASTSPTGISSVSVTGPTSPPHSTPDNPPRDSYHHPRRHVLAEQKAHNHRGHGWWCCYSAAVDCCDIPSPTFLSNAIRTQIQVSSVLPKSSELWYHGLADPHLTNASFKLYSTTKATEKHSKE